MKKFDSFPKRLCKDYTEGLCSNLACAVNQHNPNFKIRLLFKKPDADAEDNMLVHAFLEYEGYYVDIYGPTEKDKFAKRWQFQKNFLLEDHLTHEDVKRRWPSFAFNTAQDIWIAKKTIRHTIEVLSQHSHSHEDISLSGPDARNQPDAREHSP